MNRLFCCRIADQRSCLVEYPALYRDRLAAPVYAAHQDKTVTLEALYCYTLAGNQSKATTLLEKLIFWAGGREDWPTLLNIFEIRDEAESYAFVETIPRAALHYARAPIRGPLPPPTRWDRF